MLWSVLGPLGCLLSKYIQMSTRVHAKGEFFKSPASVFMRLYIQLHQTEVPTLEVLVQSPGLGESHRQLASLTSHSSLT